jgi:organic hydroperoxide reductase OsmC/OhrA
MAEYSAVVKWRRGEGESFVDKKFSRGHAWHFDGGVTVPASSAPNVVRPPLSVVEAVDPEEALVASLSSCHMLFFLYFASAGGYVVDSYEDNAVGVMGKGEDGKIFMKRVTLRPKISFSGENQPSRESIEQMHLRSHEECYIANSVKSEVTVDMGDV